jgi:hypothetical protein
MLIDDGGSSSAEAARRAAEEAARRAAEEAARKAAEEAARAAAEQAAADEAAERAFQQRMNHPVEPPAVTPEAPEPPPPPSPPPAPPQDVMEPAPPMNRIFRDEIAASQAETAALGQAPTAQTYRVDPSGNLVRDDWYRDPQFNQPAPTSAPPAPPGVDPEEYQVAVQAHGTATRNVDAQITAALDDQGPNSREAQMLRAQRDRLINARTQNAVQDFRDTRDAQALVDQYTTSPASWQQAASQMGLDPASAPDAVAIKDFLQFGRQTDANAQIAGQIALNNLPPNATAADSAAAQAEAEARSRLEAFVDRGVVTPPAGVDPKAWLSGQTELAGETARVQTLAAASGQDPQTAVAQSDRLYEIQLDAGLASGQIKLEGATPEQIAEWKAREVSRFKEAVALANENGLSMADAQARITAACAVVDKRAGAQLQINGMVDTYNGQTTAVQRGGERILGNVFGGGLNHMEQAQADLAAIEALEKQYSDALLNAKGPISPEQQQALDAMKADIDGRIDAATAAAGLQAQVSQQRAYGMSFVETGLFTVVYTGSALLGPLGLITGGVTKAFLQDLPNGKIRNNGNAFETIGDLTVSAGLGVGQVALNKIPGSAFGLNVAANGGYGVVENVAYQLRDDKPGVDWQQVAFAGTVNAGGAVLGHVMGLPAGRLPNAGAAESQLFQAAVAGSSASIMDAATQYATTGQVDPLQAFTAAGQGVVGSFTSINPPEPELGALHPTPAEPRVQAQDGSPAPHAPEPGVSVEVPPPAGTMIHDDAGNPVDPNSLVIVSGRPPALDPMVAGEPQQPRPGSVAADGASTPAAEPRPAAAGDPAAGPRLFQPDWMPSDPAQVQEWEAYMETQHGAQYVAVHPDTVDQPNAFLTENRDVIYDNIQRIVNDKVHPDNVIDLSVNASDPLVNPEIIPPPGPIILVGGYLSRDNLTSCVADQMATLTAQGYEVIPHPYATIYTPGAATPADGGPVVSSNARATTIRDDFGNPVDPSSLVILRGSPSRLDPMVAGDPIEPTASPLGATPPADSGLTPTIEAALLAGMQLAGVAGMGVRSSNPEGAAWHGVGGSVITVPNKKGPDTFLNPVEAPMPPGTPMVDGRPVTLVDGKPVFPSGPIDGNNGAIFPTKPEGSQSLGLVDAQMLDIKLRARTGAGLLDIYPRLQDVYVTDGAGRIVAEQKIMGGAKPVVQQDGTIAVFVSDVDMTHAVRPDGTPLTDREIRQGLMPAINDSYIPGYPIVNHPAHMNGMLNPKLNATAGLDRRSYWESDLHSVTADGGYQSTAPVGETFKDLYQKPGWQPRPNPGGPITLPQPIAMGALPIGTNPTNAEQYAALVNSNVPWSWDKSFPGGDKLTDTQKATIKDQAIAQGLIPSVRMYPGTKFPDFESAGLVLATVPLPPEMWQLKDEPQFDYLDARVPGGIGTAIGTWHHNPVAGRMELVPYGIHHVIFHEGGRSKGMWADAER